MLQLPREVYRKALLRAAKRGVRKILYVGDFEPSGLLIEIVAAKEMAVDVERISLTMEQIKKYRPPSIPVNRRDSRARDYIKRYGDRGWEVEALRPRTLLRVLEGELKKHVPSEYLVEAEKRERAAEIARPVTERLRRMIEKEVFRLLEEGKSKEEIRRTPSERLCRQLAIVTAVAATCLFLTSVAAHCLLESSPARKP